MSNANTPDRLLVDQLQTLRSHLPGVREGDASSIHDSRVATRRVRELLELVSGSSAPVVEELRVACTRIGKSLGRARDADVRIDLIASLETRIRRAAPWLVTVRQEQERARRRLVRRVIKRLEKLEIAALLDQADGRHAPLRRMLQTAARSGRWRHRLSRMISTRARSAAESIEHATGVYFPNRMHGTRIALKKFRYALEIAHAIGIPEVDRPLRRLKKTQDILGDLHDRQTLLEEFASMSSTATKDEAAAITIATQVVEAEVDALHGRYLARRQELLDIARRAETVRPDRSWVAASLITASAGALVLSTAYVGRRPERRSPVSRAESAVTRAPALAGV